MKKNLKHFMIFVFVISTAFLAYRTNSFDLRRVTVDSGFDSSWDSGGSSWSSSGSSWDSGSSWSSSSSSGGYGDEELSTGEIIFMLIIFNMIIIYFIVLDIRTSKKGFKSVAKPIRQPDLKDKLTKYGIDEKKMLELAYETYVDIQNAWMKNDINLVKEKLSDELYNTYKMQLLTLKRKNQSNIMSDFNYLDGYIYDIDDSNDKLSISVFLNVNCKDYLIDLNTEKVLRGNKNKLWNYEYTIDYLLAKNKDEVLKKCPNCGAGLDEEVGSRLICPYCRTLLVRNSPNLVMTRKHMNNQR